MAMHRRDFLRIAGAGAALGAVSPLMRCPFLSRPLHAAMLGGDDFNEDAKMLVIFLRGGVDGLNTVIPQGDDGFGGYNAINRPTLFIPEEVSLDLGNGFARAHPALEKLVEDVPADSVAYLHRVGYDPEYFTRSHFYGQQYWENTEPGNFTSEEGWINRLVANQTELDELGFAAASVSVNLQVAFRGERPLSHIPDLDRFTIGSSDIDQKLLGATPGKDDKDPGAGLLGIYAQPSRDYSYDEVLHKAGVTLGTSLEQTTKLDSYTPAGDATYPSAAEPGDFPFDRQAWTFFRQLQQSVQLLKETECRIAGIQLDGFDTHSDQANQLSRLLEILAHGLRSVYQDTEDSIWDDLVVVTVSEFGRTSAQNGSFGTDHGEASCMIIEGGSVVGGIYNCDSDTWDAGDTFSTPEILPRYVAQRTDFRAVLAEIMDKHFGAGAILDPVIPGWSDLTGSTYDYLEFL